MNTKINAHLKSNLMWVFLTSKSVLFCSQQKIFAATYFLNAYLDEVKKVKTQVFSSILVQLQILSCIQI